MNVSTAESNIEIAGKLGLLPEEYERITEILGRTPNFTELSIFSVMWSEHCSYKNSILWLKTLPRDGGRLLVGAGEENAGLVDIGDGLACAFKIESHNHPSFIEPYQGAATGVGGIHRDIFTMGARPVAALNSLRFGDLNRPYMRHLVDGVVRGIGNYGNCFGVPTVAGETYFHPCYNQNILVNAMSAGLVRVGETVSAVADGPGNPVFIVGSATGKDGIHGATFASADLSEDSSSDLPAVQVGDPFQEKLLLEASLEAIKTGALVGMQDMGAAGITCSTSEMAAKSGTGMRIYLDKVPTRQDNMQPFEILLSESQERMLVIAKKGEEDKLLRVFDKWDLECEQIGEVSDTGRLEYYFHGEKVADVPAHDLVLGGGAPVYEREYTQPEYFDAISLFDPESISQPASLKVTALTMAQHVNLASRRWISEQYDSMVRTNTVSDEGPSDAAVVRIKGTSKALALTVDCNSSYVFADPYKGAMIAVCEAARNIVCSGGQPLAITNCLNFGNPYNPEVYYQFVHAIKGMGDACRALDTPVTGGNVSFYNQSQVGGKAVPVYPTPTIGMLGILDDVSNRVTIPFKQPGDLIYLLGDVPQSLKLSEYLRLIHHVEMAPAPDFDLDRELALQKKLTMLIAGKLISSAHDVSEGGLYFCLLEKAMTSELGFEITIPDTPRSDAFLFDEAQSRVVVTVNPAAAKAFEEAASGINFLKLGSVQHDNAISVNGEHFLTVNEWCELHENSLPKALEGSAEF